MRLPDAHGFRFLIRDGAGQFTASFDTVLAGSGITAIRSPPRSPQANAFAERWVRALRHELMDRTIIWNERQLRRLRAEYVEHYGCKSSGPSDGVALGDELAIGPLGVDGHLLFSEALLG